MNQEALQGDVDWVKMRPWLETHKNAKANRLYAAKKSFKMFLFIYMGHYLSVKPAPFQLESYELSTEDRLLIVYPRTYGKSVTWSIGYPLWVMLNNPYNLDMKWNKEDLIMISNTATLCEKWIRYIKRELTENNRIKSDYEPTEGKIWRSDEIEVNVHGKPHGRILARGSGAQIRGEHPTELILDDLENREEAASEGPREKMREYFYQDLWGTLRHEVGKETRVKIVGTFVHPLALLPELYDKDWWTKRKYAVYNPDGTPLWPEYRNDAQLQELRSQIPETAWASEYMNAPIVSLNPTFRRETFKSYQPGLLRDSGGKKIGLRDMYIVSCLDPAISQKDGADYSASATYGVLWDDKDARIYCLDARRGHWSLSRQITEMMALYEKFPGSVQLIETVAYQKALYYEYKERLNREGLNVKVLEVIPNKDKGMRANAVTHLFEKGFVYYDVNDKMQQMLMDELALFDYSKRKHGRDDWVDATVHALTHIDDFLRRKRKKKNRTKPILMYQQQDKVLYG